MTEVQSVPLLPEIRLRLSREVYSLWKETERVGGHKMPLPYWAFAWSGGQALARFVLDRPETVRGKSVLDIGAGSGLGGIAAGLAGAKEIHAIDPDEFARQAIVWNASTNGIEVSVRSGIDECRAFVPDVVLAGDVFYEGTMSADMQSILARFAADRTSVYVGDPGRRFLPGGCFETMAEYAVPVMKEVEEGTIKQVKVLRWV